jgi:hypothetical protein
MLTPTKHTNIKYSVIYIAGKVLTYLQNENILRYGDIRDSLIKEIGQKAKYNFDFALTFLYSIGKIEYLNNIDAVTLLDNNNNED